MTKTETTSKNCRQESSKISATNRFKKARAEAGYTQNKLANKLKISRNTLVNYEKDITKMDIKTLETCCYLFKVSCSYIINGEADPETKASELYQAYKSLPPQKKEFIRKMIDEIKKLP